MQDEDFIEDDYYDGERTDGSNRPFMIAAGALATVFVLALLCTSYLFFTRNSNTEEEAQIAAIETQNAIIAVTNVAVTRAIAATETAMAQPTETPIPATNTSIPPTETPTPTVTPVVEEAAVNDNTNENGEEVTNENGENVNQNETAENEVANENEANDNGTGAVIVNTSTPTPISSTVADGKDSTLPQTGLESWGIALIGMLLVGVLVAARRVRTG